MKSTTAPPVPSQYVVLDVVAYASTLWRRKLLIFGMGVLGFAVALGVSYTRPKMFEATLRFMPPPSPALPLSLSFTRASGDEYRAMLNSNTVADDVVAHQNLTEVFKAEDAYSARYILQGMSKFTVDSNNFLTISVTNTDPKLAASLANEFYSALYRKEDAQSAEEARHRLNFMSGPLEQEKQRLSAAEDALRDAQQKTGLVLPSAQGALGVQQVASLRSRVSELQAQLATSLVGSTDQNPRVVALRTQLANLQGQISSLQSKGTQADSPGRLPELSLEVERREREVRFHTATLESLTKSLETSQMSESYTPAFVLVDPAEVPRKKVSPTRSKWAAAGALSSSLLTILWILTTSIFRNWRATPAGSETLMQWRRSWRSTEARDGHAA